MRVSSVVRWSLAGAGTTQAIGPSPSRVAIVFGADLQGVVQFSNARDVAYGQGILAAYGGNIVYTRERFGAIVTEAWYVVASVAASGAIIEVIETDPVKLAAIIESSG